MTNYYNSNAIYLELNKNSIPQLIWPKGNSWILVYADQFSTPRAIVYVMGESVRSHLSHISLIENIASDLAKVASLPFFKVTFDDISEEINTVKFMDNVSTSEREISLDKLKDKFAGAGLSVRAGSCIKTINDASSSAYHEWQRENLGAITVSDIDLIRLGKNSTPIEIIELKRSYISLEEWEPFPVDFPNFNILSNLCKDTQLKMLIAYNLRTKNPFSDDPSRVKLFSYSSQTGSEFLNIINFSEFETGSY